MFLFKLISFLVGNVTLIVQGEAPEKFINMAAARGIFLWDIGRTGDRVVLVRVRLDSVRPLRHIARLTGCRFRIRDRRGLPFLWARLYRRRAFLAGAVLFVLGLYLLSSFVWFIDVTGNRRLGTAEILKAAASAGLHRGMPVWRLDTAGVERAIQEQLPGVSWTGVTVRGTRVSIQVVEAVLPRENKAGPAHIVAKKAGLIKEVLVLSGQAEVKEGDTVVPGQVLISGIVRPPQEPAPAPSDTAVPRPPVEPKLVHASGIVRARVWYESYGEAPLVETVRRFTGRTAFNLSIKIGSKEIILIGSPKIPFALYKTETFVKRLPEWRNLQLPVEVITRKYRELEDYREVRDRDAARRLAGERAMRAVEKEIPAGAEILRRRVTELKVKHPENLVRVELVLESLEDIGKEKPFTFPAGRGVPPASDATPHPMPGDGAAPVPAERNAH